MSKLITYPIDTQVRGGDKMIGTDASTGGTKNFSVNEVVAYINESSAVDAQTIRYKFQVLTAAKPTLEKGSLSFDPPVGDSIDFDQVSEFVLSNYTLQYISQGSPQEIGSFYTNLIGAQVLISNTYDISKFGVYDWDSANPYTLPDFQRIGLTCIAGAGALEKNQEYFISLLQWNPSAGSGDKTFVFTQGTPIYQWDITHNLNKFPSVTAVNSFNEEVFGKVDYINKNRVTVTFAAPFSGQAYCN